MVKNIHLYKRNWGYFRNSVLDPINYFLSPGDTLNTSCMTYSFSPHIFINSTFLSFLGIPFQMSYTPINLVLKPQSCDLSYFPNMTSKSPPFDRYAFLTCFPKITSPGSGQSFVTVLINRGRWK